jgi:two-component system, response regulator, stage 0 sporulation protein F
MTHVFLNLIGNGFYAATKRVRESGNGSFRPTLAVATRAIEDAIAITVRDNGTGIPPEVRDKLFQPFFTTKPTGEGTGLGLSISYDIVTQQHGATIEVDSEEDAYTPPAALQWPGRQRRGGGMTVSILVVDDKTDVAALFRQHFRREVREGRYAMHFAASGEEAIARLENGTEPQLIVILSDINMPGMDGLSLLERIKQRFPDIPVMMVTAYGDDERRRRAGELGAAEFLTKPVDFDHLKKQLLQLPGAAS